MMICERDDFSLTGPLHLTSIDWFASTSSTLLMHFTRFCFVEKLNLFVHEMFVELANVWAPLVLDFRANPCV